MKMLAAKITLDHLVEIFKIYEEIIGRKIPPVYVTPSEVYELLKNALKDPSEIGSLNEGYRVGSRWSGHSKLKFHISQDGSFSASCYPNMDHDAPNRKTAERAAKRFEKGVLKYLSQVDSVTE